MAELLTFDPTSEGEKYRYAKTPEERLKALNLNRKEDISKPSLERTAVNKSENITDPKKEARRLLMMYYKGLAGGPIILNDPDARAKQGALRKAVNLAEQGNILPLRTHLENDKNNNPELTRIYDILFPIQEKKESIKVYPHITDAKKAGIGGGFVSSKKYGGYIPVNSAEGQEEILKR